MFYNEKDSYLGLTGLGVDPLSWLQSRFIDIGWTINKTATSPVISRGDHLLYPHMFLYTWNSYRNNVNYYPSGQLKLHLNTVNHNPNAVFPTYKYYSLSGQSQFEDLPETPDAPAVPIGRVRYGFNITNKPMRILLSAHAWQSGYQGTSIVTTDVNGEVLTTLSGLSSVINSTNYIITNNKAITLTFTTPITATSGQYLAYHGSSYTNACNGWLSPLTFVNSEDYVTMDTFTTELYVSSTQPDGNTLYFSFKYDTELARLFMYSNKGYDTLLGVDRQPGTVCSVDNLLYDYAYIDIDTKFWAVEPADFTFIGDTSYFLLNHFGSSLSNSGYSALAVNSFIYGGALDKFFNYSGGQVSVSSKFLSSPYYILYEGDWYGSTIALSRTGKQGYNDLVTPVHYTTAGYNLTTGELLLTQLVAGVNLTGTVNSEYKPIGVLKGFYKYGGVTPSINMPVTVGGSQYYSIFTDTNNRIAIKI
jgi:hypothetical protein